MQRSETDTGGGMIPKLLGVNSIDGEMVQFVSVVGSTSLRMRICAKTPPGRETMHASFHREILADVFKHPRASVWLMKV